MSEGYPEHWKHCTIHLNPKTGELNSDGDHSVREYIESKLTALERELEERKVNWKSIAKKVVELEVERDALRAENEQIHTMNRKLERALSESTSYKQANKIVQLESQLSVAVEALKRISEHHFIEGKTGDPLYLLEICQEEAKEALAKIEGK